MDNVWVYIHTKQDCGGETYIYNASSETRCIHTFYLYVIFLFFLKCNHTTCTITLEEYNVYFVKSCKTDG